MNRALRIAMFVGSFPVVSETFILRQITGLLDRGHEVDIYADARPDADSPSQPEVATHRLMDRTTYMDMPRESAPWEMPVWPITGQTWLPGESKSTQNWLRVVRALPTLAGNFVRTPRLTIDLLSSKYGCQASSLSAIYRLGTLNGVQKQYDVLHAHFGPVGNSFRFAKHLWRAPLVVSFHGYDASQVPKRDGHGFYGNLFHTLDIATVNSKFMEEKLRRLECPSEKIRKILYGVDLSQFDHQTRKFIAHEPVRALTIARLTEKKGIEYAIRAVAQVRQSYPRINYGIIGDGPLRPQLQQLIEQLDLGASVTLHGAKTGQFIREMLSQAQIFILPSVTASDGDEEGTPVSLLEAQASGIPVLSTWHSGIPEIVRNAVTGFLVPERDVKSLAERLAFLIRHPESCVELGRNGRQFIASNFDSAQQIDNLIDLYRNLAPI